MHEMKQKYWGTIEHAPASAQTRTPSDWYAQSVAQQPEIEKKNNKNIA